MQTIVVFVLDKRSLCNAKIQFFESCLSDDFPKTFVWILFDELDGFLETYSGEQVACVSEALLVVHNKHFLNVLDLLGVLQHVIQEHALNLQISEVADVASRKNGFFWFKVSEDKQTILLHESTQSRIVRRPLDGPHFLALNGQVLKFSLPYIQLENKLKLRCRPQQLKMNCDSTKFSIIDINGILSFYDLNDANSGPNG